MSLLGFVAALTEYRTKRLERMLFGASDAYQDGEMGITRWLQKQMKTKTIGTIGELAICSDLLQRGCQVFKEITDGEVVDYVVLLNTRYTRVQVKTISIGCDGFVYVTKTKVRGRTRIVYDESDVDVIAFYVIDSNRIVYVKLSDFGKSQSLCLRYQETKTPQKVLHRIEDFTFERAFLPV